MIRVDIPDPRPESQNTLAAHQTFLATPDVYDGVQGLIFIEMSMYPYKLIPANTDTPCNGDYNRGWVWGNRATER